MKMNHDYHELNYVLIQIRHRVYQLNIKNNYLHQDKGYELTNYW